MDRIRLVNSIIGRHMNLQALRSPGWISGWFIMHDKKVLEKLQKVTTLLSSSSYSSIMQDYDSIPLLIPIQSKSIQSNATNPIQPNTIFNPLRPTPPHPIFNDHFCGTSPHFTVDCNINTALYCAILDCAIPPTHTPTLPSHQCMLKTWIWDRTVNPFMKKPPLLEVSALQCN